MCIRLCRLAGKNHPKDWFDFYYSHNGYEWALQVAANIVEPFGEDRDDVRHSNNTDVLLMQTAGKASEEEWAAALERRTNYTGDDENDQNELKADPAVLAKIRKDQ